MTRHDRKHEPLVTAELGSEQYSKSGDSYAVDSQHIRGPADFYPRSADAENLENQATETDPNYLEALRKTEGGQAQVDEQALGRNDGDDLYGPTGDVTTAHDRKNGDSDGE